MASELSQEEIACMQDIFSKWESGDAIETPRYRVQHVPWMDVLDKLVHSRYVLVEAGKYRVTLDALSILCLPAAERILETAETIFVVLKEHYRDHLNKPLLISDIAEKLSKPAKDVANCISYMADNRIWGAGQSQDLWSSDAYVAVAENALKYETFADAIAEQQSWGSSLVGIANTFAEDVSVVLGRLGAKHVTETWAKALARRATDPAGAITAARSLLEAVCKTVLDQQGANYDDTADLQSLYRELAKGLELTIDKDTDKILKQTLGGCHSVIQGVGAMRNRLGDSHGKGVAMIPPAPRHAELAVNLSGAMALFLIQTSEARVRP